MLLRILEVAGVAAGAKAVATGARRSVQRAGLKVAATAIALVGVGFLTSAGWLAIAERQGALQASLWVGGLYLVLATAVALSALAMTRPAATPPMTAPTLAGLAQGLAAELNVDPERKGTPTSTALIALAAGFVIGRTLMRR